MKTRIVFLVAIIALLTTFCLTTANGQTEKAVAELHPLKNSKVTGTVTFTKEADGIHIVADIKGLTPGEHGIHIHEKGDCSDPEGKSAGAHFNPTNVAHGAPGAQPHHAGDFGNLTADESGNAKLDLVSKDITFEGANSILNRAVIVHEKADDLKTQPAGDSGARIACGEIKASGK